MDFWTIYGRMAARECEIQMTLEILDEVAFLFVEQFDGMISFLICSWQTHHILLMEKLYCSLLHPT